MRLVHPSNDLRRRRNPEHVRRRIGMHPANSRKLSRQWLRCYCGRLWRFGHVRLLHASRHVWRRRRGERVRSAPLYAAQLLGNRTAGVWSSVGRLRRRCDVCKLHGFRRVRRRPGASRRVRNAPASRWGSRLVVHGENLCKFRGKRVRPTVRWLRSSHRRLRQLHGSSNVRRRWRYAWRVQRHPWLREAYDGRLLVPRHPVRAHGGRLRRNRGLRLVRGR